MKVLILLMAMCCFLIHIDSKITRNLLRHKRDVVGALDIVTNHAQPIHADVKSENGEVTEKPCHKSGGLPSNIEPGTVFQVIPPKDVVYQTKSLRKSLPLNNKLELVRSISRVITLVVLFLSAVVEFYPVLQHLFYNIYSFIYLQ